MKREIFHGTGAVANRRRARVVEPLAQWFGQEENAHFCREIAQRLHDRASNLRACGRHGAARECDAIAALIAVGDFDWQF
jgi:hypothetical protein